MSPDARLAELVLALREAGVPTLVMRGHAVRFYGVERTAIDFDLVVSLAIEDWRRLPETVARARFAAGAPPVEGAAWRPDDYRRFIIGRLPDGREERLEFWRRNHLLAPFPELHARRREGLYGGTVLPFLGLRDLLRSKETERESDWQDIAVLEEIYDGEMLRAGSIDDLRSRRGVELALREGLLSAERVESALARANHPVAAAHLIPLAPGHSVPPAFPCPQHVREVLEKRLSGAEPGSARHLALVEVVRRLYKRAAMEADRADKVAVRRG